MNIAARSLWPGAAVILLLLTACGGGSQPPAGSAGEQAGASAQGAADEEKVVNVYNWSDYIDESVVAEFEKEFGIRVNYDVFDSNEVLETRLLAGNTGYDVVVPSASFLERQIKAGVFQKLDKSQLPNLQHLDPQLVERVALHDPGNEHSVIYLWGTTGLGYNVDQIRKRMPDAPLQSWRLLYDPEVAKNFADCGISVLDAPSEVIGTVLMHLGKDPNSEEQADLEAAEKVLMAIRPYVRYAHSSRYIDDLANGEICLALGWSGDVLQARDRAREAGRGVTVGYSIPQEGTIVFFDMLAIPADAPHPRNAHLFINFLQRPEIAARNSSAVNFATPNTAAWPLVAESVRNDPIVYPPQEVLAKLQPDLAESPRFTRQLTRTWTRFRTGK